MTMMKHTAHTPIHTAEQRTKKQTNETMIVQLQSYKQNEYILRMRFNHSKMIGIEFKSFFLLSLLCDDFDGDPMQCFDIFFSFSYKERVCVNVYEQNTNKKHRIQINKTQIHSLRKNLDFSNKNY